MISVLLTLLEVLALAAITTGAAILHPSAGFIVGGVVFTVWVNAVSAKINSADNDDGDA